MKIAIYIASAFWMALFLLLPTHAFAQSQRNPCFYTAANPGPGNGCISVSSANPFPVAATATIGGGFTDAATGTPISVTNGGVTGTLPAGSVVAAFNVGTTNTAFCKLGASATTSDIAIPPASWFAFSVGASTQLTCITSTSTTTVNMVGGSGLPTGSGGGGGGSAITNYALETGGNLAAVLTAVQAAIPAGTNLIGKVGIDQTTPGTTNAVSTTNWPTTVDTNTGNAGASTPRSVISTNNPAIPLWGHGPVTPGTSATGSVLAGATFNSTAPTFTTGQQGPVQVSSRGGLLLGNGYPAGSTPITISGTGTTAATTATLATGASVTTYICGFSIRANATAAATGNATITGTITGTLNFTQWTAPNASGLGVTEMIFSPCVPASAVNTGIAIISAAPGTGGIVSVTGWGYTL